MGGWVKAGWITTSRQLSTGRSHRRYREIITILENNQVQCKRNYNVTNHNKVSIISETTPMLDNTQSPCNTERQLQRIYAASVAED